MILRFFLTLALATAFSYFFYDFIYHKIILAILVWIIMYIVSWRMLKTIQDRRVKKIAGFQFADIEAEKTVRQGIEKLCHLEQKSKLHLVSPWGFVFGLTRFLC